MPLDQLFSSLASPSSEGSPLGNLLQSPSAKGALSGAASGAVVSLLMNKKMRKKVGKNAAKIGGAAAIAGLGLLAYRQWRNHRSTAESVDANSAQAAALPELSGPQQVSNELQVKMILSMIAAASADGTIDDQEMDILIEAINHAEINPGEKSQLTSALNAPPTIEELAALPDSPEEASELYGAALTAIEADTPAEHLFLRRFAGALELEPELVKTIHQVAEET